MSYRKLIWIFVTFIAASCSGKRDNIEPTEIADELVQYSWENHLELVPRPENGTLPQVSGAETLVARIKLPLNQLKAPAVSLRIRTFFEAFEEPSGTPIISYLDRGSLKKPRDIRGSARHIIPISTTPAGKFLTIKISSASSRVGIEGPIYWGEKSQLERNEVEEDSIRLLIGIFLIFFGALSAIMSGFYPRRQEMWSLSAFSVLLAIWTLAMCSRTTLDVHLGGADGFWTGAIYWPTFLAVPIFFQYVKTLDFAPLSGKILKSTVIYFSVFAAIAIFSALSDMMPLRSFNKAFNGSLLISMAMLMCVLLVNWRNRSTEHRIIFIGMFLLAITVALDSTNYLSLLKDHLRTRLPIGHFGGFALYISMLIISGLRIRSLYSSSAAYKSELEKKNQELELLIQKVREANQYKAIANTVQMVVHDVRKPFSLLKTALDWLGRTADPNEFQQIVNSSSDRVNRALLSVNSLLTDILELGAPIQSPISNSSISKVVTEALLQGFHYQPRPAASVKVKFRHQHLVKIDSEKAVRVLANIVGNALQAINDSGSIQISTAEDFVDGKNLISISIKNDGPPIPMTVLPNIFDAFVTKGKRGGTGLGLAIAKKITEDYGGSIRCESSDKTGVAFSITWPASALMDAESNADFETSGLAIVSEFDTKAAKLNDPVEIHTLMDEAEALLFEMGTTLKVSIVDDDPFYSESIKALFKNRIPIQDAIEFSSSLDGRDLSGSASKLIDLLILDINLGGTNIDGLGLTRRLRAEEFKGFICINSDGITWADSEEALEAGADVYIQKPIGQIQLAAIIIKLLSR